MCVTLTLEADNLKVGGTGHQRNVKRIKQRVLTGTHRFANHGIMQDF